MPDCRRTRQAPPLIDKNLTRDPPPTEAKCATGLFGQQCWPEELQLQLHIVVYLIISGSDWRQAQLMLIKKGKGQRAKATGKGAAATVAS